MPTTAISHRPRTASEQGDYITRVIGRVGCNLLIGFVLFKILVVIVAIAAVWLFWEPFMRMLFHR